jgi:hypothetical protein
MPDVVDASARLRVQFLGRDAMLPNLKVLASDLVRDANAPPVEALKQPHGHSSYNPAFRAIQKQREHERLVSNLLRLKRNAPRPESGTLQLGECYPRLSDSYHDGYTVIKFLAEHRTEVLKLGTLSYWRIGKWTFESP